MTKKVKILCTICARKGSKGLKNKNFKNLNSKPLIYHSIMQAKKSKLFNKIVVSSDSKKILFLSKKFNVDYIIKRPKKLSTDNSSKVDAIKHALLETEKKYKTKYDIVVDLDITSPLRMVVDIKKALKKILNSKNLNLVTGTKSKKNPYFNQVIFKNKRLVVPCSNKKNIYSRQEAPEVFDLNASIYIWRRTALINSLNLINSKTLLYKMPDYRSIDIDNKLDFQIVNFILKKKLFKHND
jgi:CMP-N-acetylneuraminic acid synthetase